MGAVLRHGPLFTAFVLLTALTSANEPEVPEASAAMQKEWHDKYKGDRKREEAVVGSNSLRAA